MGSDREKLAEHQTAPAGPEVEARGGVGRQPTLLGNVAAAIGPGLLQRKLATRLLQRKGVQPAEAAAPAPAPAPDGAGATVDPAAMGQGDQQGASPVAPTQAVSATTGEVKIDEKATDPVNTALAEMKSGSSLEKNTQKRIADGKHKIAYLEDLATDPKSDELLKKWGYDPKQYTVKINPWDKSQMIVQNNAVGFAIGANLVGSKNASKDRWKTLMTHEVSHLVNKDNDTKADSFERYKGEFRAYFLSEFAGVKDKADRARQVREHILRDYAAIKGRYDKEPDFKKQIDGHLEPDVTDNLDNH